MKMRIGIGYDIHQLVAGRKLILGGIEIPHAKGLLGHSDGDALLHAIADAMLGALALGDIGRHFPDTDPAFKNADSAVLLARVREDVAAHGWKPSNLDVNVIAQQPKLMPHIESMRERVASILAMEKADVSIKARTNEGLDAIGEGRAIAVQAVVMLQRL